MDNLINEYFIECYDILSSHLVDIFNAILDTGHFPAEWSCGVIVPIFKKKTTLATFEIIEALLL